VVGAGGVVGEGGSRTERRGMGADPVSARTRCQMESFWGITAHG